MISSQLGLEVIRVTPLQYKHLPVLNVVIHWCKACLETLNVEQKQHGEKTQAHYKVSIPVVCSRAQTIELPHTLRTRLTAGHRQACITQGLPHVGPLFLYSSILIGVGWWWWWLPISLGQVTRHSQACRQRACTPLPGGYGRGWCGEPAVWVAPIVTTRQAGPIITTFPPPSSIQKKNIHPSLCATE